MPALAPLGWAFARLGIVSAALFPYGWFVVQGVRAGARSPQVMVPLSGPCRAVCSVGPAAPPGSPREAMRLCACGAAGGAPGSSSSTRRPTRC